MDGRERVRRFLLGSEADYPPFLPFSIELAARLAQASPEELFSDPHLLTQSLLEAVAVCDLESVVLALPKTAVGPPDASGFPEADPVLDVVREGLHRLRSMWSDRIGIAVLLPGPLAWVRHREQDRQASLAELEEVVARLLPATNFLQPQLLDGFGVLEDETPEGGMDDLSEALAALWNLARYYAVPSMFVSSRGVAATARIGANAISVWEGASPDELVRSGAGRVGVPVATDGPPTAPRLRQGGFYTTAGEIPAQVEVEWVRRLVAETRLAPGNISWSAEVGRGQLDADRS
jgi:hypothetical protein